MTDRDEFAKAAMNGFASNMGAGKPYNLDLVAKQSYEIADAMLRAREVPHKTMEQLADEYSRCLKNKGGPLMPFELPKLSDAERQALGFMLRHAAHAADNGAFLDSSDYKLWHDVIFALLERTARDS